MHASVIDYLRQPSCALVRLVLDRCGGRLVRGQIQIGKARGGTSRCVETYRSRQPHQVEKPSN
jgi:hypothetical protein